MRSVFDGLAAWYRSAALMLIVICAFVALMQFRYVPMSPDGGWYSYPGYAWAMGGDPSENVPGADLSKAGERLVTTFVWENRSNLIVPLTGLWFKAVPASFASISLLGALQWILVSGLVGGVVWIGARDALLAATASLMTLSDTRLISESISDARPDVPVAIAAVAMLGALTAMFKARSPANTALAFLLAVALPLMHLTSANSIALVMAVISFCILLFWRDGAQRSTLILAGLMGLMMAAVFLLRQPILDILVPTSVPREIEVAGQHSLLDKLKENINFGIALKLKMEWERWSTQFNVLNFAQLIFIGFGMYCAAGLVRSGKATFEKWLGPIVLAAFIAAAGVLFAINPHHTPGHALVLAILAYAGAAMAISAARKTQLLGQWNVTGLCAGFVVAASVLKLVHVGAIQHRFAGEGISNAAVEQALDAAVPRNQPVRILGASEVWPYLARRKQKLHIIDPNRMFIPKGPASGDYAGVSLLVVNEDHYSWGWGQAIERWRSQGLVTPVSKVGECQRTRRCMEIYAFGKK